MEVIKCKRAYHPDLHSLPYSCQNILIRQYNFPAEFNAVEEMYCEYQDRIPEQWEKGRKWYNKKTGNKYGINIDSMTEKNFVKWAEVIAQRWLKMIGRKITGLRVVRYTNVSSGYPCLRLDIYSHNPKYKKVPLYSNNYIAPNIEIEKDNIDDRIIIFGE